MALFSSESCGVETLVSIGDFFVGDLYPSNEIPECLVPACNDELNVNFVVPPLCIESLPYGPFLNVNGPQVNFSVPHYLRAALTSNGDRGDVFSLTEGAYNNLGKKAKA